MKNSETWYPPESAITKNEIEDVKSTVNVAEAAALAGFIPVSNHNGVKTTPPPKPTKPPKNPAYKLDLAVISKT